MTPTKRSANPGTDRTDPKPKKSSTQKQAVISDQAAPKKGSTSRKPRAPIAPPPEVANASKETAIPQLPQNEAACALEGKRSFRNGSPVTAGFLYLIFAFLLIGIHFWSPERLTISASSIPASSSNSADLDLTGRQHDFEEVWRSSLVHLGFKPDLLIQSVKNRLEEKEQEGSKLKWVVGITNLTLPVASNEAQLVKVGSRWKENCAALGWEVTATSWGRTARARGNILWVRLESSVRLRWVNREIQLPMQKITIIQPLRAYPKRRLNLEGLIPREAPDLKGAPALGALQSKPVAAATPRPLESPAAKENNAIVQPTPQLVPSPAATAVTTAALPKPAARKTRARVAIIIDDVGYLREAADELLKVPASLTWSVLPFTPYSDILVEEGRARGFEIMLHLPLEAVDKKNNPGPGVIRVGWSEAEVRKQLDDDLQAVPGISGINNHMGSAGTADDALMGILMGYIKEKGLFFIDSETSSHSVAEQYARQYGVPTARRDVFIDNQNSVESKKTQLRELIRVALKNGRAIGIGHTREGTGTAILEMLPEFVKAGIKIVPVSELVR